MRIARRVVAGTAALAVAALWTRVFPELYAADRMPAEKSG